MLLPGVAYTFEGGAYRDLMIRLGYDPRFDSENGPKFARPHLQTLFAVIGKGRRLTCPFY